MARKNKKADVRKDFSKAVGIVGIISIFAAGIFFGCNAYRKVIKWRDE